LKGKNGDAALNGKSVLIQLGRANIPPWIKTSASKKFRLICFLGKKYGEKSPQMDPNSKLKLPLINTERGNSPSRKSF
jgi:hypothetical protein